MQEPNVLVRCPECIQAGQRSKVYPQSYCTDRSHPTTYWDEDGVHHIHDKGVCEGSFGCSLGHTWTIMRRDKCETPGCDYGTDSQAV